MEVAEKESGHAIDTKQIPTGTHRETAGPQHNPAPRTREDASNPNVKCVDRLLVRDGSGCLQNRRLIVLVFEVGTLLK